RISPAPVQLHRGASRNPAVRLSSGAAPIHHDPIGRCSMSFNPRSVAGTVRSDINVTPLVDVCLVLLIVFMLVMPILQAGVKVDLPKTGKAPSMPAQKDQLTVSIKGDGTLWVRGTE